MYGCEILFDAETAASVRAELTKAMGECPCASGRACPLLPADIGPLLDPASRVFNTHEEPLASAPQSAGHAGPRVSDPGRSLGSAQAAG